MENHSLRSRAGDIPPEQNYALSMESHHYQESLGSFGEHAPIVIFAHHMFFPRSSATGMETLATAMRKEYGLIDLHNFHRYHKYTCKRVARELIKNGQGFALLLAGTFEYHAREGFPVDAPFDHQALFRHAFLGSDFFQKEF